MKSNKYLTIFLLVVNIIGSICLFYFAIPYLTHDVTVAYPDAMLPLEAWDRAGMALTFGLIPLLAANLSGFLLIKTSRKPLRFLFFVPGLICFTIVASYWITSLT